jgi:hypothetical protein
MEMKQELLAALKMARDGSVPDYFAAMYAKELLLEQDCFSFFFSCIVLMDFTISVPSHS